jgi:hypothetical protein
MKVVVVGHGMVGQRFLETLVEGAGDFSITTLAEEPRLAYDRVNLSKYFSGSTVEDLTLTTREFFDKNGIELYSGDPVAAIDRVNKRVTTRSGAEYEYDVLILATGSSPFVPPIPGKDRPGVFVYRTIEDLEAITEAGKNSTRGVVIGCWAWKPRRRSRISASLLTWWSSRRGSWPCRWTRAAAGCCAPASKAWACRCTPARTPRASKTARARVSAWCSRTADSSKPTSS